MGSDEDVSNALEQAADEQDIEIVQYERKDRVMVYIIFIFVVLNCALVLLNSLGVFA